MNEWILSYCRVMHGPFCIPAAKETRAPRCPHSQSPAPPILTFTHSSSPPPSPLQWETPGIAQVVLPGWGPPTLTCPRVLLFPKGHSPGWGHPGWSPEKNPQQYPGDAGTDEPDPVGGGLTFTCLGSPLPPGPAPSTPPSRPRSSVHRRGSSHLPGGHRHQEEPSIAPARRRHQEYVQLR